MAARKRKPPWETKRPAKTKPTDLSPAEERRARARARRAGRRYPNLVDNIAVTRETKREAHARRR